MATNFNSSLQRFFGFNLNPKNEGDVDASPIQKINDDGAVVTAAANGYYVSMDSEVSLQSERDLINRYRALAQMPEVAFAIQNIVNEAIVIEGDTEPVSLSVNDTDKSELEKESIREAWDEIISLSKFNTDGYQIFERWYVDGKIYYYVILDVENGGIKEIRQIDPRKIRKVKTHTREINENGISVITGEESYFSYTESDSAGTTSAVRLHEDSVIYAHSGLIDSVSAQTNVSSASNSVEVPIIKSYIHGAIKPANQLQLLEEAILIYRLVRAPERRAFYIDIDGIPNAKADQYMNDMINKLKNKASYDASTGVLNEGKRHMAMIEDFFLPRRNGKSTEITTLPGGQGLGDLNDLEYFRDRLINSLYVPKARYQADAGFQIGKSDAVSRDEVTFNKFITKLRNKFNDFLYGMLRIQLVSKGIIENTDEAWNNLKTDLSITYNVDNYFSTLKELEILTSRLAVLNDADTHTGKYLSKKYLSTHVLGLTEDEFAQMEKQIRIEAGDEVEEEGDGGFGDDFGGGNDFGGGGFEPAERGLDMGGGDDFGQDTGPEEPNFDQDPIQQFTR